MPAIMPIPGFETAEGDVAGWMEIDPLCHAALLAKATWLPGVQAAVHVRLRGWLDSRCGSLVAARIAAAVEAGARTIVLDLGGTSLAEHYRDLLCVPSADLLARVGGRLVLLCPPPDLREAFLEARGLDLAGSLPEAMAACADREPASPSARTAEVGFDEGEAGYPVAGTESRAATKERWARRGWLR